MVKAIVGANWGDEGKGKITDMFAQEADIVIRFQGGANAGHTIINNYGRFALHTMPSGVFGKDTVNIVGNGMAFDVERFMQEYQNLLDNGVPAPKILVSERAQVVMPYHVLMDTYEEERLGKNAFGSTKSGIAPFFSDKMSKIGFQVCELYDDEYLKEKIHRVLEIKNLLRRCSLVVSLRMFCINSIHNAVNQVLLVMCRRHGNGHQRAKYGQNRLVVLGGCEKLCITSVCLAVHTGLEGTRLNLDYRNV